VRSLPRRQAQVVALHYLGDLPVAEIARVLGCAEGTVKAHLHFGSVWVPSQRGGEVLRIDLRTEPRTVSATGRIEVAGEPAFVTAGTDATWVGTTEGNLHRIDPRTGTLAATYPLGRPLHGMAVDGRWLWTVDPVGDTVSRARLPGQGQRP
jgi:outer membrane protein assembly factor BamB